MAKGLLLKKCITAAAVCLVTSMTYAAPFRDDPIPGSELRDGLLNAWQAPPIGGISEWINTEPLSMQQLRGKVVLVGFWTSSCVDCVQMLTQVKNWYRKYHKYGLEVVSIHSPEFDFEKDPLNVRNAVKKYHVSWPVALDNHFVTWQNFHNHYWPAHYLINKKGYVVYQHFGDGEYAVTENNIRQLLGLKNRTHTRMIDHYSHVEVAETPDTWLGYERSDAYAGATSLQNRLANYAFPQKLDTGHWALQGPWTVHADRAVASGDDSRIRIHFTGRKVFVVMGSSTGKPIAVTLRLDGKTHRHIPVKDYTVYEVASLKKGGESLLELQSKAPGLEVYTFAFTG